MYTIYLADREIHLASLNEFAEGSGHIRVEPPGKFPFWEHFTEFLSGEAGIKMKFCSSDPKWLFRFVASFFEPFEAAGGLVKNEQGQLLFIYRQGKWDLPKGHPETGESIEETALREVEEECGIDKLKIISPLPTTFHLFDWKKDRWAMKKTWWYWMETSSHKKPKPQSSEQIEKAEWFEKSSLIKVFDNTYGSVKEVVGYALEQRLL
jgi:8-oxo-dGTP pyrophosphatase MutT (NUDIX family)